MQYEVHRYCGSPLLEIVAQLANASDENAAGDREPGADDEDEQNRLVIHGRQEGKTEPDQRR